MSRPSNVWRVPLLGKLLTPIVSIAVAVLLPQTAPAEVTQQELAKICQQAIADKSVWFDPPRVSINNQELDYSAGQIFYPRYAAKPVVPFGFPVGVQFYVELIRKYRAGAKGGT